MNDILNPEEDNLEKETNNFFNNINKYDYERFIIQKLKKININGSDKDGKTVLMLVISRDTEFIESVQYLIKNGADVSKWYTTKSGKMRSALTYAIAKNHVNIFKLIIEALRGKDKEIQLQQLEIAKIKYSSNPDNYKRKFLEIINDRFLELNDNKPSGSFSGRSLHQRDGQKTRKQFEERERRRKKAGKRKKKGRYNIKF